MIHRHGFASRAIHWSTALAFFACLLTGLPIWWPGFGGLAYLFGGLYACRVIHPWAGAAFFATAGAMFLYWTKDMVVDSGKYNGGQRLFFFAESTAAFVLFSSGLVLWFPRDVVEEWRELAILAHDLAFVLLTAAIVGHIYFGTAAGPGTFRAMIRGTVTREWARFHHPRWFSEVSGEGGDQKRR